nr:hypothetical protein [Agrobacterium tumefaciens]
MTNDMMNVRSLVEKSADAYMTLETMAQMSDDPQISLPAVAR